jgi:hypothetical protein
MEQTNQQQPQQPPSVRDLPDPTPQIALNTFVGLGRQSRLSYDEHVYLDKCTAALQNLISNTKGPEIPPFPKMQV